MPQFLVEPSDVDVERARALLRGDEARHLTVVLRAQPGQAAELFDGLGRRWLARLVSWDARSAMLDRLRPLPPNESALGVELVQALPKGEKWEWVLEKGTELGVTRFQPVRSERSVTRIEGPRLDDRRRRWAARVISAAKQCERAVLPEVADPVVLESYLASLGGLREGEIRIALAERKPAGGWPRAESSVTEVRLAIGPEGGWTAEELRALESGGFSRVGLGPRVLRAETAALAGVALVQARWGGLENPAPPW